MDIFAPGQTIAQEGDPDNHIYVLMAGKVGIYKGEIKIAEFSEQGVILGEMSAILNEPRTASIRALETSTLFTMKGDLDKLMLQHPEVVKKILVNLAKNLKRATEDFYVLAKTDKKFE